MPATHDASQPSGLKFGDTLIKAGKLRGVESAGMMCSAGEMGLDLNLYPELNKEGILILPKDTPVGNDIHTLFDLDDVVYEMELTANRADCFSMIGMALEVGAIFNRKVTLREIAVRETGLRLLAALPFISVIPNTASVFADASWKMSPLHVLLCGLKTA